MPSGPLAPLPADLADRRVEITGPGERKMMINALNSGARTFMADFEDSSTPTFDNVLAGQRNAYDAVGEPSRSRTKRASSTTRDPSGRALDRPRGWHLPENNLTCDGEPMSGVLVDFRSVHVSQCRGVGRRGSGPYFYLPKLESHLEARLWNDVFVFAQRCLGSAVGTIKATVLIETILAAFEMDEILYELRDHSAGLNAGRWDYIFSMIKKFRNDPSRVLPDRSDIGMTCRFMRRLHDLLIQTCHKRGAHAMGGMAAFIPNRTIRSNCAGIGQGHGRQTTRSVGRLRRNVGGASRTWSRWRKLSSTRVWAIVPIRSRSYAGCGDEPQRSVGHHDCRREPSRLTASAPISTWAFSTSPRGCAATERPRCTT